MVLCILQKDKALTQGLRKLHISGVFNLIMAVYIDFFAVLMVCVPLVGERILDFFAVLEKHWWGERITSISPQSSRNTHFEEVGEFQRSSSKSPGLLGSVMSFIRGSQWLPILVFHWSGTVAVGYALVSITFSILLVFGKAIAQLHAGSVSTTSFALPISFSVQVGAATAVVCVSLV